jgi:N,N-dimethylformamidase beta subunit-like, C-terminal
MAAHRRQPSGCLVAVTGLGLAGLLAAGCTNGPPARQQPGAHLPAGAATRIEVPAGPDGGDVRAENARAGYPGWRITSPGPYEIAGYTDRASALPGTVVRLFVSTTAAWFRVRALRFGWYGGALARLVWTSAQIPGTRQPAAVVEALGMVVALWRPSLAVPTAGWPPGSYLLRLDASSGAQQYVPLVIRSPSVAGRVVLVQPTTTYQAYNLWGGYGLYYGPQHNPASRARVVSFDRPYDREQGAADFFAEEQPLLSYAERLGLPLAYISSVDLDLDPHVLDGARAVVSEAHDEYWSQAMRAILTRARDRGVNLAFLGANEIYRRIRLAASPLGPDRIEVNYRNPREDPLYGKNNALVTANWPAPPAADPESSLTGQVYACASARAPLVVTEPRGWIWAGTGARPGMKLPGLIGKEFDTVDLSQPTPRPIQILARSPQTCAGRAVWSDVTYYVAASGAGVLNVGTEGWLCGLPTIAMVTNRCLTTSPPAAEVTVIERATRNILDTFARGPAGRVHPATDFLTGQVSY